MIVFVSVDITLAGAAMVCAEVWTVEDEPDWFVAASLQPGGGSRGFRQDFPCFHVLLCHKQKLSPMI